MTTMAETKTVHVHQVFIKASQQAIWDAITQPEWIERYGPAVRTEYESLRPGGAYRAFASEAMKAYSREQGWPEPDVMFEGEVIDADPPRRLVQTWHPVFDEETSAEPATRLTYEIEEWPGGTCRLTLTHDVTGAPVAARIVGGEERETGGGWAFVLSDLKTLLETGSAMGG